MTAWRERLLRLRAQRGKAIQASTFIKYCFFYIKVEAWIASS